MDEKIHYIEKIEIKKLWGRYDLKWVLNPDVNILSGINGSGKSTVLDCVFQLLRNNEVEKKYNLIIEHLRVSFFDGYIEFNKSKIKNHLGLDKSKNISFIKSSESGLLESEAVKKLTENNVQTNLDWMIYLLQSDFINYQLYLFKNGKSTEKFELFYSIINELFKQTNKRVDKSISRLSFLIGENEEISPYQLSTGEKQILIVLLNAVVSDTQPYILLLDEPEISLHFDWQKKLIGYIRDLNPNIQLIIATHSPAIIMEGWLDKVINIEDIMTPSVQ